MPDPDTAESLTRSQRRYIELVHLLNADGWNQKRIARALDVSQSYVSQIVRDRAPAITMQTIEKAIEGLPIDPRYFTDPSIPSGDYKAHMGKRSTSSPPAALPAEGLPDSAGWRKFKQLGLDRVYMQRGLSADDLDYVSRAPGRKGAKTLDFYVDLCDALVKGVATHPEFDALDEDGNGSLEGRRLIRRGDD
jgi:transcriptional regulator with XRE-family HTH domain